MGNITQIQLIGNVQGYLDLDEETILPLTFALADIRDISSRTGSFSKSIKIKGTKNNNKLLNHYFDVNIEAGTFDINIKQSCIIIKNGVTIFDNAIIQLVNVDKIETTSAYDEQVEYTLLVKDSTSDFFTIINNKYLEDLDLKIPETILTAQNVINAFDNDYEDGFKYMLPYAESTGVDNDGSSDNKYNLNEFKPAIFVRKYFDRIFAEATGNTGGAGYRYSFPSMSGNTIKFNDLLIPYNGDEKITEEGFVSEAITEFSGGTTQLSVNNYNQYGTNYFIKEIPYHKLLMPVEISDPDGLYNNSTSIYTTPNIPSNTASSKFEYDITFRVYVENNTGDDCTIDTQGSSVKIMPKFLIQGINFKLKDTPIRRNNGNTFNPGQNTLYSATLTNQSFTIDNFPANKSIEFAFKADIYQQTGSGDDTNRLRFLDNSAQITRDCEIKMEVTSIKIRVVSTVKADYGYNVPLDLNKFIPKKIKQSDFLKGLFGMFNLYAEVDRNDPQLINIERRDTFYDSGVVVDWSEKLVKDESKQLTFLPALTNKKLVLTYKQDSDEPNKLYFDTTNEIFGQQEFIYDNQYVKEIDKKEFIFSPTPMVNLPFGAVVPMINGGGPKTNIRILIDGGQYSCGTYSIFDYAGQSSSSIVSHGYYSHISHWDKPVDPTFDLNFGICDFYYRTNSYGEATNNTLFNMHWRRTVNQINNGKMLSAHFDLNENDIAKMRLSDKILVNNSYWNINKVIDFDANSPNPTKVELISADDELSLFSIRPKKTVTISAPIWGAATGWLNLGRVRFINTIQSPNTFVRGFNNWVSPSLTNSTVIGDNNTVENGEVSVTGSDNIVSYGGVVNGSNNVIEAPFSFVSGSNNYVPSNLNNTFIMGNAISADTSDALHVSNLSIAPGGSLNGVAITAITGSKIFYNVLDYGVIGDGLNDDTISFNNTIAIANANNGIVFIPKDINVTVNNSILLPSNISIQGGNKYTSKVSLSLTGSTTAKVLRNSDFSGGNTNISLSNFTINGANLANTVSLELQKCTGVTINNMIITEGGIEGVYLYLANNVIVNDLLTFNNGLYQVDASGIHFDTCDNFILNGCVSYSNGFHGVICSASSNGQIKATTYSNGFQGIYCQFDCNNIVIDCVSYDNFRGVYLNTGTNIMVKGIIYNCVNGLLTNEATTIFSTVISYGHDENDVYLVGETDTVQWQGFPSTPIYTKEYGTSTLRIPILSGLT